MLSNQARVSIALTFRRTGGDLQMAESLIGAVSPTGTVKVKPRRAWIAGLLALLQPGLGHLYGGRPVLALLIELSPSVFALSAAIFSAVYPRWVLPAVIALVAFYARLDLAACVCLSSRASTRHDVPLGLVQSRNYLRAVYCCSEAHLGTRLSAGSAASHRTVQDSIRVDGPHVIAR